MTKHNHKNYILFAIFTVAIGLAIYKGSAPRISSITTPSAPSPIPSPTPTVFKQESPDGSKTVQLKFENKNYQIYVNDQAIEAGDLALTDQFSIPFNTWSPDNKYFFLKGVKEYYVFNNSSKLGISQKPIYAIRELFVKSHPDDTLVDVTGWASPTLLLLNATTSTGAESSYWFDIQTGHFIRLSTYFN
ncbi:MAG: hypothetical protein WCL07_01185 [bacterium]